jgi:hypothetical protein
MQTIACSRKACSFKALHAKPYHGNMLCVGSVALQAHEENTSIVWASITEWNPSTLPIFPMQELPTFFFLVWSREEWFYFAKGELLGSGHRGTSKSTQ